MSFLKKSYWTVSVFSALALGAGTFVISYRSAKNGLIAERQHTLQVVTNVKLNLLERKLYSVDQQLALLSRKDVIIRLLTSTSDKGSKRTDPRFDEYIKGLLYNQGCSDILLVHKSGEVVYSVDLANTPKVQEGIYRFAQEHFARDSAEQSKVVLGAEQFYVGRRVLDRGGNSLGALFMEVPRQFLSVELANTISQGSLNSYLISSQGIMDQTGLVDPDTCSSCRWSSEAFISFAPVRKIGGTWALRSVYPTSQIDFQHSLYISVLDGMIAFFAAGIIIILIAYGMQMVERSRGITSADTLLVQTTWNTVSEYSIKIIAGFYKHLFSSAPEVRPLFKSNQAVQEKRMASMINTIVNSVDSLEEFRGSITQLAKSHTHMGVKREYFPVVVNALINSVADQYGQGFTSAHRKAWLKILNRVSAIMIEEMESYQRSLRDAATTKESDYFR